MSSLKNLEGSNLELIHDIRHNLTMSEKDVLEISEKLQIQSERIGTAENLLVVRGKETDQLNSKLQIHINRGNSKSISHKRWEKREI